MAGCKPAGRIGDMTYGHNICPTAMVTGSDDCFIDCLMATRTGDLAIAHVCVGEVTSPYTPAGPGSMECFIDCLPAFRMLDNLVCGDPLVTGSLDVFIGG